MIRIALLTLGLATTMAACGEPPTSSEPRTASAPDIRTPPVTPPEVSSDEPSRPTPVAAASAVAAFGKPTLSPARGGVQSLVVTRRSSGVLHVGLQVTGEASKLETDVGVRARCQAGDRVLSDASWAHTDYGGGAGALEVGLFKSGYANASVPLGAVVAEVSRCEIEVRIAGGAALAVACWDGSSTNSGPCVPALMPEQHPDHPRGGFFDVHASVIPARRLRPGDSYAVRVTRRIWLGDGPPEATGHHLALSCLVDGRWITDWDMFGRFERNFFRQEPGESWIDEDRPFVTGYLHLAKKPDRCNVKLWARGYVDGERPTLFEQEYCFSSGDTKPGACPGHPRDDGPSEVLGPDSLAVVELDLHVRPDTDEWSFAGKADASTRAEVDAFMAKHPGQTDFAVAGIMTLKRSIDGEGEPLRGTIACEIGGKTVREQIDFFDGKPYRGLGVGESTLISRAVLFRDPPASVPGQCEVRLWLGEESESAQANIPLGRWCRTDPTVPMRPC